MTSRDNAPDHWRDAFTEEWSVLEIAYAVALDGLESLPTAIDHDIVEALARLEQLVVQHPNGHQGHLGSARIFGIQHGLIV